MADNKCVLSYYRIKEPEKAWSLTRWWDEGRQYELLKCIATVLYENKQDKETEDLNQAADDILQDLIPSEADNSNSSTGSGVSSSSIESGKIVNRLGEIKEKVWKWFSHLRNTTAVKNGKDRIFEAAVFLYRHWSIIDFEQKVLFDQKAISDFTDAMSRLDSNGNTIEVDEATRQLLAGEAYLSLDRIPPEFLQKPAKLQNRHSDEKFKVEVDSSKPIFNVEYKRKRRAKNPPVVAKKPKPDQVSSLSCLFD